MFDLITCDFDQTLIDSLDEPVFRRSEWDFSNFACPLNPRTTVLNTKLVAFLRKVLSLNNKCYIVTNRQHAEPIYDYLKSQKLDDIFSIVLANPHTSDEIELSWKAETIISLVQTKLKELPKSETLRLFSFDDDLNVLQELNEWLPSDKRLQVNLYDAQEIWTPPFNSSKIFLRSTI